jgi:tetratricopeptide (TPR) repeat protein
VAHAQVTSLLGQAIDLQTRGMVDDAIQRYEKAIAMGAERPAIRFNVGALYQQKRRFPEATEHFAAAARAPEYALGSQFALAECYRAQDKMETALTHFVESLKIVDLAYVRRDRAGNLQQLYADMAARPALQTDRGTQMAFMSAVADFLGHRQWEQQAENARRHLDNLGSDGYVTTLAELLEVPDYETILDSLSASQGFVERQLYLTAAEECYRAINLAPGYLPLQLQLADIIFLEGRSEDAIAKTLGVADTYLVRGDLKQATGIYGRMLKLTPMDFVVRSRLLDLLVSSGEIDHALEEYLALADAHYRMAQVDKAMDAYNEALRLAMQSSSPAASEARVLHLLGDISLQSVDWVRARKAYQRIVSLMPGDKAARARLVDLAFKLQDRLTAIQNTDELVKQYLAEGAADEALAFLQELSRDRSQDVEVRARLARLYVQQGMRDESIAELNVVGEMQLDAGMYRDAAESVRLLATLEPEKAADYQVLLNQILGRQVKESRSSGGE